jgi:2-polyprenyl-3-methyl-5-hydroxy-6-metoxy-1,4-benzoquinol methylase
MKSYYHAHESAYQQIKSKGYFGWGNAKTLEDLGDDKTKEYLRSTVSKYIDTPTDKKVLDLGCGSGTTAFTLAKLGFNVTGLDISQTAIEMAQDLALKQELKIQFHELSQAFLQNNLSV